MKAISLWQPWASLCCIEHPEVPGIAVKRFETRSWSTLYTGRLLIHAAKHFTKEELWFCHQEPLVKESLLRHYPCADCLPRGAIIGSVYLESVHPSEAIVELLDGYAWAMGNYDPGRFGWAFIDPVLFDTPVPYRGQQGLFNVRGDILRQTDFSTCP